MNVEMFEIKAKKKRIPHRDIRLYDLMFIFKEQFL